MRDLDALEEFAALAGAQLLWGAVDAVVKQRRLNALHPLRALADQRVSQPRPRPPLAHVLGRDPRLGQPALGEQFLQPAGVLAIGLRSALAPAQRARLDRLGQMRRCAGGGQPIAHEQPAGSRLDGDMDLVAAEARQPAADGRRRRIDPTARYLGRLGVQRVEGDLRSMHVKPGYDRDQGPSSSSRR